MDYKKLYYKLCQYCKDTDIKYRIKNRNPNDFRLSKPLDIIYTEKHHIIPRHCGGNDDESNLVIMLPEEHYMAHLIRWKAYNSRNDFLAVRLIVNGLISKQSIKDKFGTNENFGKFKYRLLRWTQHIYEFRKTNSWHTQEGIKSISKSRMGTMPAIDLTTGKSVGSVDVNHKNVLNGKWIHHSKGKLSVTVKKSGKRLYINVDDYNPEIHVFNGPNQKGKNNGNYKAPSPLFIDEIFNILPNFIENNHLHKPSYLKEIIILSKKYYKNKISEVWLNNHLGGIKEILNQYNIDNDTNYVYNPYYRGYKTYTNLKGKKND